MKNKQSKSSKQDKHKPKTVSRKAPARKTLPSWLSFGTIGIVLIILIGIICYSNSFDCSFHFDDAQNIVQNKLIRNLSDVASWWSYVPSRPLGIFTFAVNYHFNELDVWGYHLVNLIIHLCNALLVFWLVKLVFKAPAMKGSKIEKHGKVIALITALLFVSHPVQTQAVTYIVQRLASLAALFYLSSLCFYASARVGRFTKKKRLALFATSGIAALLAFLTKENTYTLPLAILVFEFVFIREKQIKLNVKDWKIWAFSALLLAVVTFAFTNFSFSIFKPVLPEQGNTYTLTAGTYLLTQFRVILTYMRLLLFPAWQNLDYDYPISHSLFEWKTLVSFIVLLGIFFLIILFIRKYRLAAYGMLFFFTALLVECSFIPIVNVIFEHRMYLPSVGFFMFITALPFYLLNEKRATMVIVVFFLIIPVLTTLTINRNKVWKNDLTLWGDVIKKSPNKPRPLNNMGDALVKAGRNAEAIPYFDKAIRANPAFIDPLISRGDARRNLGDLQGALQDYTQAIRVDSSFYATWYDRGYAYYGLKEYQAAIRDFDKSIALNPSFAESYMNRACTYAVLQEYEKAITDFNKAIELTPEDPIKYANRGQAKFSMNDKDGACADWQKAAQLGDMPSAGLVARNCGSISK